MIGPDLSERQKVEQKIPKNFRVVLIVFSLIMIVFAGLLIVRPSVLGAAKPYTMKELQNDYVYNGQPFTLVGRQTIAGNFMSFNPGDTVFLIDRVAGVELTTHFYGTGTATSLSFDAFYCPTQNELEYSQDAVAGNGTWYLGFTYPSQSTLETNFPVPLGSSAASIGVDGDITNKVHVGDTVEIAFHVYNLFEIFQGTQGSPTINDETIREFKYLTTADNVQVISSGAFAYNTLYSAVPLIALATILLITSIRFNPSKESTHSTRTAIVVALSLAIGAGIMLQIALGLIGPLITTFSSSIGRLISTVLGAWWVQGFGLVSAVLIAVVAFFRTPGDKKKEEARDDPGWAVFSLASIMIILSLVITNVVGSVLWGWIYGLFTAMTPMWNLITIVVFIFGLLIPYYIGGKVAAFFAKIANKLIQRRIARTPPLPPPPPPETLASPY
jgi:hypothetical protein